MFIRTQFCMIKIIIIIILVQFIGISSINDWVLRVYRGNVLNHLNIIVYILLLPLQVSIRFQMLATIPAIAIPKPYPQILKPLRYYSSLFPNIFPCKMDSSIEYSAGFSWWVLRVSVHLPGIFDVCNPNSLQGIL